MRLSPLSVAARVAVIYGVAGAGYVLFSGTVSGFFAGDTDAVATFERAQGGIFVVVTTALVYLVVRRHTRRAEEALERLGAVERQERELIGHSFDAIMLTGPEGGIISANPATCDLFGYTEEQIQRLGHAGLLDVDDPRVALAVADRSRTGRYTGVLRYRRADGSTFEGETASRVFEDVTGVRRTTVIVRDISARVAAEQALERSEAAYRALFEEHHSPSLLIDPADGRIVDANAAALRFYGWSVDELTHKRIQEINTLTEAETRHEMARAARRGQNWFRFQHRLASGEVKDVDVYSGPVTLGERTLLLSLVHDQTPLHVVQASLTRMNKLHAMLSETNQAMLRSTNRDALVQQVCEIAVAHGGFRFAWAGWVQDDGAIIPFAKAGDDGGYVDALRLNKDPDSPWGQGPTGRVVRSGAPVIVNRYREEMAGRPWADLAEAAGILASASLPLSERGTIVGAFMLYVGEADFFGTEEVATLVSMAADISFALDHLADARERTTLARELEVAELRWRYALEGARHGVWEHDLLSGTSYLSPFGCAILGYDPSEVPHTIEGWTQLTHPEDRAAVRGAWERHLQGGSPMFRCEYRCRCKDGTWKWMLVEGSVVERDASRAPRLVVGTQSDLTEMRALEAAREESESRARRIVDNSTDLIYINRDDLIDYINPAGVALLEATSAADVVGRPALELFHPDCHLVIRRRIERLRSAPGTVVLPMAERLLTRTGKVLDVETTAVSYLDRGHLVIQVTCRDITSRLRTERALAATSEQLRLSMQAAGSGVFDLDFHTGEMLVSPEYARTLGYDPTSFHESRDEWTARVHPEDIGGVRQLLQDCLEERTAQFNAEFRLRAFDGSWRWVHVVGRVTERDTLGSARRMVGTHTDITARRSR